MEQKDESRNWYILYLIISHVLISRGQSQRASLSAGNSHCSQGYIKLSAGVCCWWEKTIHFLCHILGERWCHDMFLWLHKANKGWKKAAVLPSSEGQDALSLWSTSSSTSSSRKDAHAAKPRCCSPASWGISTIPHSSSIIFHFSAHKRGYCL